MSIAFNIILIDFIEVIYFLNYWRKMFLHVVMLYYVYIMLLCGMSCGSETSENKQIHHKVGFLYDYPDHDH